MIPRYLGWLAATAWLIATPVSGEVPTPPRPALPDPSTIARPRLDFTPTAQDAANYDKYFYFQRDDTGFAEAYEDLLECDALASGINFHTGGDMSPALYQYGVLGAAIGGAIGSAISDAIYGSAGRRRIRRVNMRNCMGFKGYRRYGLSKDLWEAFNFEEGNGRKEMGVRKEALMKQALVASGPKPQQTPLGR